ncbi:MAG: hypothetical protein RR177_04045, partial [Oscillospiraceae bacterium]
CRVKTDTGVNETQENNNGRNKTQTSECAHAEDNSVQNKDDGDEKSIFYADDEEQADDEKRQDSKEQTDDEENLDIDDEAFERNMSELFDQFKKRNNLDD